ncbi:hypothetical protein VPH526E571_0023 [Vibrio phage 526E57-1]
MSQVQFTLIARAVAFAGTGEEKVFDNSIELGRGTLAVTEENLESLKLAQVVVVEQAQAYEAENAQVALFAQVEAAQGKKLTKPQRELLALTLSIQGGTYENKSVETETVQSEPETVETTKEVVNEPPVKKEAPKEQPTEKESVETTEEVNADDVVKQAIAEDTAEQGKENTDAAVEDALAALGL